MQKRIDSTLIYRFHFILPLIHFHFPESGRYTPTYCLHPSINQKTGMIHSFLLRNNLSEHSTTEISSWSDPKSPSHRQQSEFSHDLDPVNDRKTVQILVYTSFMCFVPVPVNTKILPSTQKTWHKLDRVRRKAGSMLRFPPLSISFAEVMKSSTTVRLSDSLMG